MKVIVIVIVVIILIIVLIQFFTIMTTNKTGKQKYSVIQRDTDFEIRFYPAATLATIYSNARRYKELSGPGFRALAGYIFGGNASKTKISMTAPVHMDINDSSSTMSFVMPPDLNETNLPKPNNPKVIIERTEDEYVAAIRFGGFVSENDLQVYSQKLQKFLRERGISSYGHYRFLGYNPPYQFFGRRNEIIVSIHWKEK
jgi:hypothetical protein